MINNTRSREIIERDYSIGSHQSGISGRFPIPRNGLAAEYLLNGNALDTSSGGNNGTVTNTSYAATQVGYTAQCADFDPASGFFVSSYAGLNSGDFTVSVWAKRATTADSILFGSSTGSWGGIRFYSPTMVQLSILGSGVVNASHTPSTGVWYHYVLTRSGDNYVFYADTVSVITNTTAGAFSTGTLNISGVLSNGTVYFKGVESLFRAYNRALSLREIQALYNEGRKLLH